MSSNSTATATLTFDAELIDLLGGGYKGSEYAIRELVDNAWDADADNVWITVPEQVSPDVNDYRLVVKDDGSGMLPDEMRRYYLNVASNRHRKRGDFTQKERTVKGRKGIGKFSGLYVGAAMAAESCAGGQRSQVAFTKEDIKRAAESGQDLQTLQLPFLVTPCEATEHGTTITITQLHQRLLLPEAQRIKRLLALDYCRTEGFNIFINGELLDVTDVPGQVSIREDILPDVGPVRLRFVVAQNTHPARLAGIGLRVKTKIIGKPSFYGARERLPDLPKKFFSYIFGEVEADSLLDLISAHWGPLPKDTRAYRALDEFISSHLEVALRAAFQTQLTMAKARLQKQINQKLLQLPEHQREYARQSIEKAIRKHFLDVPKEKLWSIIQVILDAIERDEYWEVLKLLDQASHAEVGILADALNQFGMIDLTRTVRTANVRTEFLTHLQALANNTTTKEQEMHEAIASNLWLLGPDRAPLISNQSLASTVKKLTGQTKYTGKNATKRPDLLLAQDYAGRYLLIEFKRPSHAITRQDVAQAEDYRQELTPYVPHGARIEVLLIGGKLNIDAQYKLAEGVEATVFNALISEALTMLSWLTRELASGK